MDRNPYAVGIVRGDGLIARFGDVVLYIAGSTSSARPLLATVELAAKMEHPGAALAERLAALTFGADSASVAPFGLVAPAADGLLVLLRGTVTAEIEDAEGVRTLSGERSLTWVDEILPDSLLRVAIAAGVGSGQSECPETDLRAGVVPGGGFVWLCAGAAADRSVPAESVAPETMLRATVPTKGSQPSVRRTPAETPALPGVAGVLAAQDGAVYPLDRPYVIGRDPLRDDAVRTRTAAPIIVSDPRASRVHAYVWIDGGAVFVRDASTPGGTFLTAPGMADWTEIGTTPTKLELGGILRIGEQILTFVEDRP